MNARMTFVHIGRGKCGSSTLQRLAAKNRDTLAAHGLRYPVLDNHQGSQAPLATALLGQRPSDAVGELARFLRDHADDRVLISSEHLANLRRPHIRQVRELLGDRPVRIIAYVRPYADWIASFYAERTRTGRNVLDFDQFFARFQQGRISFRAVLEAWAQTFGWENMRVRTTSPDDLVNGSLVDDFLDAVGGPALPAPGRPERVSPPWFAIEAARWVLLRDGVRAPDDTTKVQTTPERKIDVERLIRLLARCGRQARVDPRVQYLTPAQSARWNARFDEDMAAIGCEVGREFPHAGRVTEFRPFLPSVERIPPRVVEHVRDVLADPAERARYPNGNVLRWADSIAAHLRPVT